MMRYQEPRWQEVLENIGGAVLIVFALLFQALLRRTRIPSAANAEESARPFPGDERVPDAQMSDTQAITIATPVDQVWPWLVQIGQERGGLYSYEVLENIARCAMTNADRIHPEWQTLGPGDAVRLGPKGYPLFRVTEIEAGRWIVMAGANPATGEVPQITPDTAAYMNGSWAIVLKSIEGGAKTRLLMRWRTGYKPNNFSNWLIWIVLTGPIGWVMTRQMLIGIRRRVEFFARQAAQDLPRSAQATT